MLRFTVVSAVRTCAGMSSSPSTVWRNSGSPSGTSRAKKRSKSRRTSGGVNHGEVVVGVGLARRQLNRATKRRLGRFAQPLFSQRDAEILERVGILRVELRGPAERVERFIVLLLPDFQNAEHGQTGRVLRVRSQRPFQIFFRRGQPAQFDLGLRKVG